MSQKFLFYVVVANKKNLKPPKGSCEVKDESQRVRRVGRKAGERGFDAVSWVRGKERERKCKGKKVSSEKKKNSSLMQPFPLNLKRQASELKGGRNLGVFLKKKRRKKAFVLCLFSSSSFPFSLGSLSISQREMTVLIQEFGSVINLLIC